MAYSDKVISHYENPRNVGSFDKDAEGVGTGMVGAPACFTGDTLVALPGATGTISLRDMWVSNQPTHVWSLNVKTNQFELRLARCIKTGHKDVVKLLIDDGGSIDCTPDHLFLTAQGSYQPAVDLVGTSLKSFNKIIDNNGYWQINRQSREHIALVKTLNNITHSLMWTHNIDHINENKLDNRPENLVLLDISAHNQKSKQCRPLDTIAQRTEQICATLSYDEVREMTVVEQLPRWQIGDKLNLTVEWVAEVQRYFGLTPAPKRLLPDEQRIAASTRKLRAGNPNYSGVTDEQMLQVGNALYVLHGKLTNKVWKDNAAAYGMPTKAEHRFGKFSRFVEQAVAFNHKIQTISPVGREDVFCLQVEENNNFVVVTSSTLNRQTGVVVKNCGDVMKLQIRVKDGIIEDARFKTYGCGSAIASSSLVTEWVKGKTLDEAGSIKNSQIAEELALPPVKIHCSILAEDAIKAAIQDYRVKHG